MRYTFLLMLLAACGGPAIAGPDLSRVPVDDGPKTGSITVIFIFCPGNVLCSGETFVQDTVVIDTLDTWDEMP